MPVNLKSLRMQYLKIPERRIHILQDKEGKIKKEIEEYTRTIIEFDDTSVSIEHAENGDALDELRARNVVLAIGRGFSYIDSLALLSDDTVLEVISLSDYAKGKNQLMRIRGRIIGREGSSKNILEKSSNCKIAVCGKTVSIIGKYENVSAARESIMMLVHGSTHGASYRAIERVARRRAMQFKE